MTRTRSRFHPASTSQTVTMCSQGHNNMTTCTHRGEAFRHTAGLSRTRTRTRTSPPISRFSAAEHQNPTDTPRPRAARQTCRVSSGHTEALVSSPLRSYAPPAPTRIMGFRILTSLRGSDHITPGSAPRIDCGSSGMEPKQKLRSSQRTFASAGEAFKPQ